MGSMNGTPITQAFVAESTIVQYTIVKAGSDDNEVDTCGNDERGIGIAMNGGVAGKTINVVTRGQAKVTANAALATLNASFVSEASGYAGAADTNNQFCIGFTREVSSASGNIIVVDVDMHVYGA